jgi:hypothetical protein
MSDLISDWKYRKPITISNSGSALTDYQVLVTLDTQSLISAGKMSSDGGDIRFTDSDGNTLLSYWIESGINTNSTKIWVKVPSIPASSLKIIYVYYKNPSATSQSNIKTTFNNKGDDFNDNSLDTNIWSTSTPVGTISETGQKLNISIASSSNADWWGGTLEYAPVASITLPSGDFEARVRLENYTVIIYSHPGIALWLDRNNAYLWGRMYDGGSRNGLYLDKIVNDSGTGSIASSSITTLPIYLGVRRTGVSYSFIYSTDNNSWSTVYTTSSLEFTPNKFGLHGKKWTTSYALNVNFDNAYIRSYASPEPTTSIGTEELVLKSKGSFLFNFI